MKTLVLPCEVDGEEGDEAGVVDAELVSLLDGELEAGLEAGVEEGVDDGVVSIELWDVLEGVVGTPQPGWVAVIVYVMQEQAELTAATLPAQFAKSVGMADGAVVVPERNSGQNDSASA